MTEEEFAEALAALGNAAAELRAAAAAYENELGCIDEFLRTWAMGGPNAVKARADYEAADRRESAARNRCLDAQRRMYAIASAVAEETVPSR